MSHRLKLGPSTNPMVPARATTPGRSRWRLDWMSVVIALVAITGMLVAMYPPTAAWWSQYNQSRAIERHSELIRKDPEPGNATALAEAHEYNSLLTSGVITVGADTRKPTSVGAESSAVMDYYDVLKTSSGIMGRLRIPVIAVDLPIYHGTSDHVLNLGVGHLKGTSFPVGGSDTHSVLSAHRGLASATMFNDLDKLVVGDRFVIEIAGDVLTYQVTETRVVDKDDTETVKVQPGRDIVTLVTCTPLGINTHRIVVTGERITPTPLGDVEGMGEIPDIPGFPWWAVILPSGVVLAGIYVWRSGYPRPPRPKKEK